MSDDEQSYTETQSICLSEQNLNKARIQEFSYFLETPSHRKHSISTITKLNIDEEEYDWRSELTKSIQIVLQQKTPQCDKLNKEKQTQTANIKKKNGSKYQSICPICLSEYKSERGFLQCKHEFCFDCVIQWSKTSTNCPCCRRPFTQITKISKGENSAIKQMKKIAVQTKKVNFNEDDYYICYVCNSGDNENVLLICDSCDFYCCHIYCDPTLSNIIPEEDWYCLNCRERFQRANRRNQSSRIIASQRQREGQGQGERQNDDNQGQGQNQNQGQGGDGDSQSSTSQSSVQKCVAMRTRSRQSINGNLRQNSLATLRNLRRRH